MSSPKQPPTRKRNRADELSAGWAALPAPILMRVFVKLSSAADVVIAGAVNKHWYGTSSSAPLWKCVDLTHRMHKTKLTGLCDCMMRICSHFHLVSNQVAVLPSLGSLSLLSLKNLSVSYDGMVAIAQTCSSLTELELNQANVTDATLKAIAESPYASKLTSLNLRASTLITDDGVELLMKTARRVTNLNLSWCSEISGRSVELIVAALPAVQVLNIRWCRKVPWAAIPLLATLKSLTSLNISHLAKGIPKLPEMDSRGAQEFVNAISRMKTLTTLDIAGLPFSTMPDAVTFITRSLPGLKDFSYRPENQKHGSSTAIQQARRAAAEAAAAKEAKEEEMNEDEAADEVMENIT